MSLSIGIVGLPNVGKSTLFNALVKNGQAEAKNYPFCTIDPNVGIVSVPDSRLNTLAEISKSQKVIPAVIEFVDIAGLVSGASKGEGLGNQFLANIRECDAIAMVVRFFEDKDIIHVSGNVSPEEDAKVIETELQLADLSTVEKRLGTAVKDVKTDKTLIDLASGLEKIKKILDNGQNAREAELTEKEIIQVKNLQLLTMKPVLYIANIDEFQISNLSADRQDLKFKIKETDTIPLSAKIEAELNELSDDEKKEYLDSFGIKESGLNTLIQKAYDILGLQTYFTSGEKETRAWTIRKGATAPQAAGVIHTDFERGFIAAEVIKYNDFVNLKGWEAAKEKGLIKTCGKDYIVTEGDVILFRFNV